jgi:DNA replication protein DnaC
MTTTFEDRKTGETAEFTCKAHGIYTGTFTRSEFKWLPSWWSNCPACNAEWDLEDREQLDRVFRRDADRAQDLTYRVRRCGVPPRFTACTLASYRTPFPAMRAVRDAVAEYARRLEAVIGTGECLTLLGATGTGKTHLGCALVRAVLAAGGNPLYTTAADFVGAVQGSYGGEGRTAQVLASFVAPDLLVLDEVGRTRDSEDASMLLSDLIDRRYREGKPTVVLSNLTPDDLRDALGVAAVDRLRAGRGRQLKMNWPSVRRTDFVED